MSDPGDVLLLPLKTRTPLDGEDRMQGESEFQNRYKRTSLGGQSIKILSTVLSPSLFDGPAIVGLTMSNPGWISKRRSY